MASFVSTTEGRAGRVCKEWGPWRSRRRQRIPATSTRSPPASLRLQEGVTSQTSHWSRLYFMTFYIVTMVGRGLQSARHPVFASHLLTGCSSGRRGPGTHLAGLWGPTATHSAPFLSPPLPAPGQVVMTIIVAFILEAFVFRMNYSRKNQDSEGQCRRLPPAALLSVQLSAFQLSGCPISWQYCLPVWLIFLDLLFALFSNT